VDALVGAQSRRGLGLGLTSASTAAAAEELDVIGDDLGDPAHFAFLVPEGAVLQPALAVGGMTFLDVLS